MTISAFCLGADFVGQQHGRFGHDAGHRGGLVLPWGEGDGQAGQLHLRAVVGAAHDRVERVVVVAGKPGRSVRADQIQSENFHRSRWLSPARLQFR
jgi:hypothetical protein